MTRMTLALDILAGIALVIAALGWLAIRVNRRLVASDPVRCLRIMTGKEPPPPERLAGWVWALVLPSAAWLLSGLWGGR